MRDEMPSRRQNDELLGVLLEKTSNLSRQVEILVNEVSELKTKVAMAGMTKDVVSNLAKKVEGLTSLKNRGIGIFIAIGSFGAFIMAVWQIIKDHIK